MTKIQMPNEIQNPNDKNKKKQYDLEERTARFGEKIIEFAKSLPDTPVNRILIGQVVRAGASVGANYMEADAAETKKDFHYKIGLCKKESKETKHWLRMIAKANPDCAKEARELWQETHEFVLIFSSINKRINKSK